MIPHGSEMSICWENERGEQGSNRHYRFARVTALKKEVNKSRPDNREMQKIKTSRER